MSLPLPQPPLNQPIPPLPPIRTSSLKSNHSQASYSTTCTKPPTPRNPPPLIDEDDPLLDAPPESWIASMIGTSGLLYRFSTHLVYKSNVSPREAHLTETAGAAVTLPLVSRVVWKGARPETGTKAVIMELGRKFRGVDVPADQRAAVAVQMFELLERLHAKGIVHGDVKEGNFLWDRRDGKLRIVDFGSARFVEEDEGLWDGSFATEAYFAPGRMRGGKKKVAAPRVFDDYYALAVTLWGMYAERRPGRGQFNQKTIWRTDLAEVEDDMVREWIVKVLKMAGCRLLWPDPTERGDKGSEVIEGQMEA